MSRQKKTPPESQQSFPSNDTPVHSEIHSGGSGKSDNGGRKKVTKEKGKLYQDQVYGPKVLTNLAAEIIDTPEFQRLEGIKQLGFANVTYRGAKHSRLSHSIGTYFMTKTIMRRIVQNHERFDYDHPGNYLPDAFSLFPHNVDIEEPTLQSKWRGLTEIVRFAALLHDITHVPFGHTLEDEFIDIYDRHDALGGPRLYKLLFDDNSNLSKLLSSTPENRFKDISNEELKWLIYVILSWKEKVDSRKLTGTGFDKLLSSELDETNAKLEKYNKELKDCEDETRRGQIVFNINQTNQKSIRLKDLIKWHNHFSREEGSFKSISIRKFHPFISDVIANTICADLLDYLPRDRMNLGMEYTQHDRIQRFFTIRNGTLYCDEGLKLSILVTRTQKGGQRRDVATAVLRIMRERYEMSERVYYHHKKAAVSSMLATLIDICHKPFDDESVYPAPWTSGNNEKHILHFTDSSLIEYLGNSELDTDKCVRFKTELTTGKETEEEAMKKAMAKAKQLQRKLYLAIKYRRKDIYPTLLVLDTDLVHASAHGLGYFTDLFRSKKRVKIEEQLALAGKGNIGDVLIYCPSAKMQSKEIDARLEIIPEQILPLSIQQKLFAYNEDVRVLQNYYKDLWRSYIFVSKEIYDNKNRCKAIVDKFCDLYKINKVIADAKVRKYEFYSDEEIIHNFGNPIHEFLYNQENGELPFKLTFTDTPTPIISSFLRKVMIHYNKIISENDPLIKGRTLNKLFSLATLESYGEREENKSNKAAIKKIIEEVLSGRKDLNPRTVTRDGEVFETFKDFEDSLIRDVLGL